MNISINQQQLCGLRDAHVHIAHHGFELSCLHVSDCVSLDDCLQRIASATPDAHGWIIAVGARVEGWPERRFPTARELEDASAGKPVMVRSFDFHAIAASNSALTLADITKDTPDPAGGAIDRDAATGEPTGHLLETAAELVDSQHPDPTPEDRLEQVCAALADFAARGIVEVHDMLSWPYLWEALAKLDDAEGLPVRVRLMAPLEEIDRAVGARASFERKGAIELAGVKIFTDGTLNSKTAFMLEPFADPRPDAPRGVALMTEDAIEHAASKADALGLPLVAHAIGDAAVRRLLDIIERVAPTTPGFRIEHAQFVDDQDVPRFARLNVIASMQPCHLLPDVEAITRLVPHRAHRAFPLRDLHDAATRAGRDPADLIWLGSDAPVVPPDPQDNLHAAVKRRRSGMAVSDAIAPEQALTREETLGLMQAPSCV